MTNRIFCQQQGIDHRDALSLRMSSDGDGGGENNKSSGNERCIAGDRSQDEASTSLSRSGFDDLDKETCYDQSLGGE